MIPEATQTAPASKIHKYDEVSAAATTDKAELITWYEILVRDSPKAVESFVLFLAIRS